jgi:hypothetical protein
VLRLALSLKADVQHTSDCVGEIYDGECGRTLGLQFRDRSSAASCLGTMVEMRRPDDLPQADALQYTATIQRTALERPAADGRTRIGYGLALELDKDGARIRVKGVDQLSSADSAGVSPGDELLVVSNLRVEGTGNAGIQRAARLLTELLKAAQSAAVPVDWTFRRPRPPPTAIGRPLHGSMRAVVKLRQSRALTRVMEALQVYRDIDAAKVLESSTEDFYATTWQPGYPDEDPISIRVSAVDGGQGLEVECESPTVPAMRRLLMRMGEALADVVEKAVPESTLLDKHVVSWDNKTKGRVVSYDRSSGLCSVRPAENGGEVELHGSMLKVDFGQVAATQPSDAAVSVVLREMRAERLVQRRNARIHPLKTAHLLRARRSWRLGEERLAILEELIDLADHGDSPADISTGAPVAIGSGSGLDRRTELLSQLDSLRALTGELLHNGGCLSPRAEIQLKTDGVSQPIPFLELVGECPVLSHIDLGSCGLRDSGAVRLASAVISNRTVRSVDVSCNDLTGACCVELSRCIDSSSLTSLDISTNRLGDVGAQSLSSGIARSRTLDSLSLSRNGVGKVGALAIAGAINASQSRSLRSLTMGCNPLGDDGAAAVAKALAHPACCLKALNLFSAEIGDAGAKAIAIAVASCNSIALLDLGFNRFDAQIASSITKLLDVNEARLAAAEEKRATADHLAAAQRQLSEERKRVRVQSEQAIKQQAEIARLQRLLADNEELLKASAQKRVHVAAEKQATPATTQTAQPIAKATSGAADSVQLPEVDHAAAIEGTLAESLGVHPGASAEAAESDPEMAAELLSIEASESVTESLSADDLLAAIDAPEAVTTGATADGGGQSPKPTSSTAETEAEMALDSSGLAEFMEGDAKPVEESMSADDLLASIDQPTVATTSEEKEVQPSATSKNAAPEPEPEPESSSDDDIIDLDALRQEAKLLDGSSKPVPGPGDLPSIDVDETPVEESMSADDLLASIDQPAVATTSEENEVQPPAISKNAVPEPEPEPEPAPEPESSSDDDIIDLDALRQEAKLLDGSTAPKVVAVKPVVVTPTTVTAATGGSSGAKSVAVKVVATAAPAPGPGDLPSIDVDETPVEESMSADDLLASIDPAEDDEAKKFEAEVAAYEAEVAAAAAAEEAKLRKR